jgi:uncharacterized protein
MRAISRRMFLMGGVAIPPYLYVERLSVAVRRYRVPVRNLPPSFQGFTILHLSDLHDKEYGKGGEQLLRLISKEKFDIAVLTGDLVTGDNPRFTPALELASGIMYSSGKPVYSVPGNHDWRLERGEELNEKLRNVGVQVLSNRAVSIDRGADRLWLAGVDDPVTFRARLDKALSGTDDKAPRLLLSHSPQTYSRAVDKGVDLVLSGHTHGGQIRIPFLGACYVPAMGLFPRYDYGMFRSGASTLIVSGGLGESLLPVRFNIRPEFSVITLDRAPAAPTAQGAAR